jgi:hypothetical protein
MYSLHFAKVELLHLILSATESIIIITQVIAIEFEVGLCPVKIVKEVYFRFS